MKIASRLLTALTAVTAVLAFSTAAQAQALAAASLQ